MELLPHSINEKELITEQNSIKKYLYCVAVYDLPLGFPYIPEGFFMDVSSTSASVLITKYNKNPNLIEYKYFKYNER